jgi:hypothetical protein
MRRAIVLIAGLAGLAACVPDTHRVGAAPPTVSYRVAGTDISQANVSAAQYCRRYGGSAQYQGLQATSSGNVALYSCGGAPDAASGSSVPPYSEPYNGPSYAPPPPVAQCADRFHQSLPGGTDYFGPPVAGCPQLR